MVGQTQLQTQGDTFTLDDGFNDPVTFEYINTTQAGAVSAAQNVPISFVDGDGAATLRTLTADAINNVASTNRCSVTGEVCNVPGDCAMGFCTGDGTTVCTSNGNCSPSNGTCAITCDPITLEIGASPGLASTVLDLLNDRFSAVGNTTLNETVNDVEFVLTDMTGGAGGDCGVGEVCKSNEDCESQTCTAGVCAP